MNGAFPVLDQSDILTAQKSLEVAIEKVEADAQREYRTHAAIDTSQTGRPRRRGSAVPEPPANQNHRQGRGPLTRLCAQVYRRAGYRVRRFGNALFGVSVDETGRHEGPDTWLTELLTRASHGLEDNDQDFAPKHALRRNGST
jgi:hypothetical protein